MWRIFLTTACRSSPWALSRHPRRTLTAVSGGQTGAINLSWPSAGDDGVFNDLTGYYRIQYATYTVTWSTSGTPTDATTVTIATTSVTPGSSEEKIITGLTDGITYYFVLWTQDEANNWSGISNTASGVPAPPSTVTLSEAVGQAGWMGQGETVRILGTARKWCRTECGGGDGFVGGGAGQRVYGGWQPDQC
jgi:hypothetical protein